MPIPDGLAFSSDDNTQGVTPKSSIPDELAYNPGTAPTKPIHEFNATSTGDYLNALTSGLHGLGATGASVASQATTPEISKWWMAQAQNQREAGAANIEAMSPAGQKSIQAGMFSHEFWKAPLKAVTLQGVQQAPSLGALLGATAFTGGAGAALGLGELGGAVIGGMGVNSLMNAGQAIDHISDVIMQSPNDQLMKNKDYATLRDGMNEADAKKAFIQQRLDSSGLTGKAATIGAITGAVGLPAMIGAAPIVGSLAKRALGSGVETGVALGVQAGATDVVSNMATGEENDPDAIMKGIAGAFAQGMVMGGLGGTTHKTGSQTAPHAEAQPGINNAVGSSREGGKLGVGRNGGKAGPITSGTKAGDGAPVPPSLVNDDQAAALAASQSKEEKVTPGVNNAEGNQGTADTYRNRGSQDQNQDGQRSDLESETNKENSRSNPRTATAQKTTTTDRVIQPTVVHPPDVQPKVEIAQDQQGSSPTEIESSGSRTPQKPTEVRPTPAAAPAIDNPVAESPETLRQQERDLVDPNNDRKAVIYPKGQQPIDKPMKRGRYQQMELRDGRIILYDSKELPKAKIEFADQNNRLNEVIGLGPVNKEEAVAGVRPDNPPVAVTERTGDGTEVKAAAGNAETAPAQVAALEAAKTPGNVVSIERPQQVVAERLKANQAAKQNPRVYETLGDGKERGGRLLNEDVDGNGTWHVAWDDGVVSEISRERREFDNRYSSKQLPKPTGRTLPDVSEEGKIATAVAEQQTIAQELKRKQAQKAAEAQGQIGTKHRTKAELTTLESNNQLADQIVAKYSPKEGGEQPNDIFHRASDMLDEAKARKIHIPSEFREGANHSPSVLLLSEARALVKAKIPTKEELARFLDREGLVRAGRGDEAFGARRSESAEQGAFGSPEDATDRADTGQLNPEEHLAEKQEEASQNYTAGKSAVGFQVTKTRTVSERLRAERAKVDTPKSETQKEAGNYPKGHLSLGGHRITIETPKGGTREGVTPEGKEWSQEDFPHDRGYIRGTEDNDGDHVDVIINPELKRDVGPNDKIFILNQRDPKTGFFDEHKAFIGFDNAGDALLHYQEGFVEPQGVTGRRMGGIVEMTNDEFKTWLKDGDKGQPVHDGPAGQQLDGTVTTVDDKGNIVNFRPDGPKINMGNALDRLVPKTKQGLRFIADKIRELIPGVPIYVVDGETMEKLTGVNDSGGYYASQFNHIIINADSPIDLTHVMLHESVHAATIYGMQSNPKLYKLVERLMNEAITLKSKFDYAFTNPYEFVAEAMSNEKFQKALSNKPISRELAEAMGIPRWKQTTAWGAFVNFVRNMFGLPTSAHTMLEAAMSITEKAMFAHDPYEAIRQTVMGRKIERELIDPSQDRDFPKQYRIHAIRQVEDNPDAYSREYTRGVGAVTDRIADTLRNYRTDLGANAKKWGISISSGTQLIDMFGKHFQQGKENALRTLVDARNKTGMLFQSIREPGQALERQNLALYKRHQGPDWDRLAELKNLSSTYGVHPDSELGVGKNAHIPKSSKLDSHDEAMDTWQAREHHEQIKALYKALPDDLRTFYRQERDFYNSRHGDMAAARLKVVLDNYDAPAGHTPDSILKLALTGKLDDPIMDHYDNLGVGDEIKNAKAVAKQQGPYFPAAREGDYVVKGTYHVPSPGTSNTAYDGTALPDNIREFSSRQEAHSFVSGLELPSRIRTAYYDPITKAPTTRSNVQSVGGRNISPDDRYRVTVENNHIEMANSMSEAKAQREAMLKAGVKEVSGVLDRKDRATNNQITSAQTRALIARIERRDDLTPAQKNLQKEIISQTSLANQTGNRISKHWIERRNVAGADFESVQGLRDYNSASSAYLARVQTLPTIDKALDDMQAIAKAGEQGKDSFILSTLYNEMASRTQGLDANNLTGGKMSPLVSKFMTYNFMRYLASPAHLLLHMMHPLLYSLPTLASRHGFATSYRAHAKAMSDLGGVWPTLMQGFQSGSHILQAPYIKDLQKQLEWGKGANFLDTLTSKIVNAREKGLFNELSETGHIHPSNGFTADTYTGMGLDRANRFMRELTGSTEAINRVSTALSAYRLEYNRTASHDGAILYAKHVLEQTQGMFSSTNSAPFTRVSWMRPFLQFRQFPMQIAYILGRNAYNMFKGETPEVKHQAMVALGGVLGTAGLLSGVGGMPTELLKVSAVLGNALGVTYSPEEYQDQMTRWLDDNLGTTMGRVVTEGLPSLMGPLAPSWAHRVGTGSLFTFGAPDSSSADSLNSWVATSLMGAAGSSVVDLVRGIQAAEQGDWTGAVKAFAPAKIIADGARAYQDIEGKSNAKGLETQPPMGVAPALMQLFGLMPMSGVRASVGRSAMYQVNKRESTDKSAAIKQATQGDHASALKAIQVWNSAHPTDKLTSSQIQAARKALTKPSEMGKTVTPKSKSQLDEYNRVYGQ